MYAGMRAPEAFVNQGNRPEDFKNNLSHGGLVKPEDPEFDRTYDDAVSHILHELRTADAPVGLVATGPWTNVAATGAALEVRAGTLRRDPGIPGDRRGPSHREHAGREGRHRACGNSDERHDVRRTSTTIPGGEPCGAQRKTMGDRACRWEGAGVAQNRRRRVKRRVRCPRVRS